MYQNVTFKQSDFFGRITVYIQINSFWRSLHGVLKTELDLESNFFNFLPNFTLLCPFSFSFQSIDKVNENT